MMPLLNGKLMLIASLNESAMMPCLNCQKLMLIASLNEPLLNSKPSRA